MNYHQLRQSLTGCVQRSVRAAGRRYLAVAAVVLALSTVVALGTPRGVSSAAATAQPTASPTTGLPNVKPNDDGVTWNPDGTPVQENDGSVCDIRMAGDITGAPSTVLDQVNNAIADTPSVQMAPNYGFDSYGIGTISVYEPQPASSSPATMPEGVDVAVQCSILNQADAYLKKTGHGSLGQFASAVLDADLHPAPSGSSRRTGQRVVLLAYDGIPQWTRNAIGAIVAGALFLAVTIVSVAAMVALGAATTATGGLASPALAAVAGCIGGAVSVGVSRAIAGNDNSPIGISATAIGGCLPGALFAVLQPQTTGVWVGQELRNVLGLGPAKVVGAVIQQDAAAANVQLSPLSEALQFAADALARGRA